MYVIKVAAAQGSTYRVVICDSKQGFDFSRLNSLLSWAFLQQDKKVKIIGIISGPVTFE